MQNYFRSINNNVSRDDQLMKRNTRRSEEVNEIVSDRPDPIIRWGTTAFIFVLCILVILSWLIKYPDIVKARAKLTSINAPKAVVTPFGGKLVILKTNENDTVKKGQILGFLETTSNPEDVLNLLSSVNLMQAALDSGNFQQNHYFPIGGNFGELQMSYQEFNKAFLMFNSYLSTGFYPKKREILFNDIKVLKKLNGILQEQKALHEQNYKLSQETFEVSRSLSEGGVISDFDYREEYSKMINKRLAVPQINSEILGNENAQSEKQKEIMELENVISEQKFIFQQALNTLKSQINDWLMKYALISPVNGKVAFASVVEENQHFMEGQTVCFIYPDNTSYFVEMVVPQLNMGKVRIGQEVRLSFDSYPFQENGVIEGRVDFIMKIPIDSNYIAKVSLVNGLNTTYNKQIHYREGLLANAEIITNDIRLLQRIYFAINRQTRNN